MTDFPKTSFLSPRNVPLWGGFVLVAAIFALIVWLR
jgi:hypothetical protein